MNYVNLGATGLRVSRLCMGMMGFGGHPDRPWAIDEEAAEPIVKAAGASSSTARTSTRASRPPPRISA
ncbi:MAG: hypothetical protein ACLQNG_14545 [Acidimicrobiales bacterium]